MKLSFLFEGLRPEDEQYAETFFKSAPSGMRRVMIGIIQKSLPAGTINHFVSPNGISDKDKEKLSAYRVLADELGIEIGKWRFNRGSDNVIAPIRSKS